MPDNNGISAKIEIDVSDYEKSQKIIVDGNERIAKSIDKLGQQMIASMSKQMSSIEGLAREIATQTQAQIQAERQSIESAKRKEMAVKREQWALEKAIKQQQRDYLAKLKAEEEADWQYHLARQKQMNSLDKARKTAAAEEKRIRKQKQKEEEAIDLQYHQMMQRRLKAEERANKEALAIQAKKAAAAAKQIEEEERLKIQAAKRAAAARQTQLRNALKEVAIDQKSSKDDFNMSNGGFLAKGDYSASLKKYRKALASIKKEYEDVRHSNKSLDLDLKKLEKTLVREEKVLKKTTKAAFDFKKALGKGVAKAPGSLWHTIVGMNQAVELAQTGFAALRFVIGGTVSTFMEAARVSENYRVRLDAVLGSSEEGAKAFDDLAKYASTVPFTLQEIMGAATTLAPVLQGGRKEIQKWMPVLGDLAAVSGLTLQETSANFLKLASAGAASADLFRERGINAMLGFLPKVSYTAKQSLAMVEKAAKNTASVFSGVTKRLKFTFDGQMSMLQDKWFLFRKQLMDSDLFVTIKAGFYSLNKLLGSSADYTENLANSIGKWMSKLLMGLAKLFIDMYFKFSLFMEDVENLVKHIKWVAKNPISAVVFDSEKEKKNTIGANFPILGAAARVAQALPEKKKEDTEADPTSYAARWKKSEEDAEAAFLTFSTTMQASMQEIQLGMFQGIKGKLFNLTAEQGKFFDKLEKKEDKIAQKVAASGKQGIDAIRAKVQLLRDEYGEQENINDLVADYADLMKWQNSGSEYLNARRKEIADDDEEGLKKFDATLSRFHRGWEKKADRLREKYNLKTIQDFLYKAQAKPAVDAYGKDEEKNFNLKQELELNKKLIAAQAKLKTLKANKGSGAAKIDEIKANMAALLVSLGKGADQSLKDLVGKVKQTMLDIEEQTKANAVKKQLRDLNLQIKKVGKTEGEQFELDMTEKLRYLQEELKYTKKDAEDLVAALRKLRAGQVEDIFQKDAEKSAKNRMFDNFMRNDPYNVEGYDAISQGMDRYKGMSDKVGKDDKEGQAALSGWTAGTFTPDMKQQMLQAGENSDPMDNFLSFLNGGDSLGGLNEALDEMTKKMGMTTEEAAEFKKKMTDSFEMGQISSTMQAGFDEMKAPMTDFFMTFAETGKLAFGELAKSLITRLRMIAAQMTAELLMNAAFEGVMALISLARNDSAAAGKHGAAASQALIGAGVMGSFVLGSGLGAMAHEGIDSIPKEGTWLLDKGERVVDSRTNEDLKGYLANNKNGGGINMTVNISNSDEEGVLKALPQLQETILQTVTGDISSGGQIYKTIRENT